jgi:hypothetical protein
MDVDARVAEWRAALTKSRAIDVADADELETHLRDQIDDLSTAGLADDEAFLIAVKRLGEVNAVTAEFAREHGDRLWRQLVIAPPARESGGRSSFTAMLVASGLAVVIIQVARLLAGVDWPMAPWFLRDLGLLVLPVLAGYFLWVRRAPVGLVLVLAAIVAVLAVVVNVLPFPVAQTFPVTPQTSILISLYLPVALWFVVGAAYVRGEVGSSRRRMDFVRFTGEWAIYYVLIALGGAVLLGLTSLVLQPIIADRITDVFAWVLPSGAAAAVIVAAWLVEAKKSVIENLAPVLTAIFTPLFAVMLLVAATVYLLNGIGRDFDRDLLIAFDALLLVVLGLVVYGISARDSRGKPALADILRLVAVVAAVVLDALVLGSMLARVGDLGFTPNRLAALGLNLVLLVNLLGTVWLTARLLVRRATISVLERWQTGYLPVLAAWSLVVVLVFPAVFALA